MLSSVPFFVINLPEFQARQEFMALQLQAMGIRPMLWPATDGKQLTPAELARHYDEKRANANQCPLTRGEIGCALSHLSIYRHMIERQLSCAIVLEDDAALGKYAPEVISAIAEKMPVDEPTVVLLTHLSRYSRRGSQKLTARHRLVKVWKAGCAHGYVINLAAGKFLVDELYPVHVRADNWTRLRRSSSQLTLLGVDPYCVGQSVLASPSSLQGDRIKRDESIVYAEPSFWARVTRGFHGFYMRGYLRLRYGVKRQVATY